MKRPPIRLICYAWGETYVDNLLDFCLAATMAPGNLPALAKSFDCTVVVLTQERLFARVAEHPIVRRIEAIAALRLLAIDDLITEPWQYGMTLAYTLFRGLADLGPAMTETYSLFLNADFILADGCYERLIPHILAGERAHLAPSYCAVEERVRPTLEARASANGGVLAIPPREMAGIILTHRHNTIRAKTVNQDSIYFAHADQFYWAVDEYTLLGHQMPIALIGMRPEVALADIESFWDWGVIYDFCPSKQLVVLGDSDEFLMLEMRREREHLDLIRLGKATANELAVGMSGYITQYQLDNARFPLTLHSRDIPSNAEVEHGQLRRFIDAVFDELGIRPIPHRRHAQWIYHRYHFTRTLHRREKREGITREIAMVEREIQRARSQSHGPVPERARHLGDLRNRLNALDVAYEAETAKDQAFVAFLTRETAERRAERRRRSLLDRLKFGEGWIFGAFPNLPPWSPYAFAAKPAADGLRMLQNETAKHVLVVARDDSAFAHAANASSRYVQTSAAAIVALGLEQIAPDIDAFDLCILDVRDDEFPYLPSIYQSLIDRLGAGGCLRIYWCNRLLVPPSVWQDAFLGLVVATNASRINVSFFGSRRAAAAMGIVAWALHQTGSRPKRAVIIGGAFACSVFLALLARLRGLRSANSLARLRAPCVAVTIVAEKGDATA